MRTTTRTIITLGLGVLIAGTLTACSTDEPQKIVSPPIEKNTTETETPPINDESEVASPEPTLDEDVAFEDFIYDDQDDITWIYNIDLSDSYDEETVENFEKDVNKLFHVMHDGYLVDFIYPYHGEDSERIQSVSEFLTDGALDTLVYAMENDDHGTVMALITRISNDRIVEYKGETYKVREDNPVTMLRRINPEIYVDVPSDSDIPGVHVARDITINYHLENGQRLWVDAHIQYIITPNADGNWIINGWHKTVGDSGISDTQW